jgi:hypothetical protein
MADGRLKGKVEMHPGRWLFGPILAIGLLLAGPALAAGDGTITRLDASGGRTPSDTITISSRVEANTRINNSNLYYTIVDPDGNTVATHSSHPGGMNGGEVFNDSWSTDNGGFTVSGTYTLTLCWSTGGSHNCNIDQKSTTFYSVPALGWGLTLMLAIAAMYWLWRRGDLPMELRS